ncbi:MAG TPA: YcxB family protein [Edaphobacter sp.]|nr:YcxB family protein [Edaphobacter sp.]
MRYDYVLRFDDYQDSQKLYLRHRRSAAVFYYFYVWVLPIVGLLSCALFVASRYGFYPESSASFAGFAAAGLWFALFVPIIQVVGRRRCWKRLIPTGMKGKSKSIEIPVSLEFNDEQVISAIPGKSEGRFYWSAIVDFAENEKIVLLFVHKKRFLFIPKRAMSADTWNEFRNLLISKIKVG